MGWARHRSGEDEGGAMKPRITPDMKFGRIHGFLLMSGGPIPNEGPQQEELPSSPQQNRDKSFFGRYEGMLDSNVCGHPKIDQRELGRHLG